LLHPVHGKPVALLDVSTFAAAVPTPGALLGLDYGSKRIGVAACDPGRIIASAIATVPRTKIDADVEAIRKLYQARACVGLVIGLPLNMDGGAGPSAQAARAFARNLLARFDAPLLFWDERLSTSAVERTLIAADASRKRRAEVIDQLAAAYILQGAIDRLQERI
jgi:putative Holliday junction resolvase